METVSTAFEYENVVNIEKAIAEAQDNAFDYIIVPLVHPRFERQLSNGLKPRNLPLTRSDLLLNSGQWNQNVVGKFSEWLNFDSVVEAQRHNARKAFKQEVAWATHIGVSAAILPEVYWNCSHYASSVNSVLLNLNYLKLWTRVPLVSRKKMMLTRQATESAPDIVLTREDDPWECWNKFKILCNNPKTLGVVLEITENVPEDWEIDRWYSEPVIAVMLPIGIFLTNAKGYPVLSKRHQAVLLKFFKLGVQVFVKGNVTHTKGPTIYQQYIVWLWKQSPPLSQVEKYEKPYWDYLQAPLQPLMDNLESQTYETFEKDPIKYEQYEKAITKCLAVDPFLAGKDEIVLMVLGAGRGPLVSASMRASKTTGRKLKLYALEKNPNAVNTLLNLKLTNPDWKNVTVISTDIREYEGGEDMKADVIVSELLGSFGDNELSPECLYGAEGLLKPGGISIPQQYESFIAPLSSSKLFGETRSVYEDDALKNFETAYVVKFHAVNMLDKPQSCFEFLHPSVDKDCTRHQIMTFNIPHASVLHGFAGFFDSQLYDDVHISILPATFTDSMFSWFPLFFPIRQPTYLKAGSVLEVHFLRLSNAKQVWYEWSFSTDDVQSPLHNPNGRSWWIGL